MCEAAPEQITVDGFLVWGGAANQRSELTRGEIIATLPTVRRRGESAWTVVDLEAADQISLESIGCDIPVAALYDGLDFSETAAQG